MDGWMDGWMDGGREEGRKENKIPLKCEMVLVCEPTLKYLSKYVSVFKCFHQQPAACVGATRGSMENRISVLCCMYACNDVFRVT